jgi:hypothetical protein
MRIERNEHPDVAFRATDPALDGYVVLDFRALDAWYEEDKLNVGHPP